MSFRAVASSCSGFRREVLVVLSCSWFRKVFFSCAKGYQYTHPLAAKGRSEVNGLHKSTYCFLYPLYQLPQPSITHNDQRSYQILRATKSSMYLPLSRADAPEFWCEPESRPSSAWGSSLAQRVQVTTLFSNHQGIKSSSYS